MTLVLSVHSRESLWLVADRRLSYGDGRPPIDDAVKVMDLETNDGRGLLAYAGLGATSKGTQPSEWMGAVLRGRAGLTFEQALGVLSDAANRELPRHLASIPGLNRAHFIIVPAFVRGRGARLYSIDNVINSKTRQHWYRFTRHAGSVERDFPSIRVALAGSGGNYLGKNTELWLRALLSLVKAHDRGKISDYAIADQLARLNYRTHLAVQDGTVGPRCIVVWRRRIDAKHPAPGSAHQSYTGIDRDSSSGSIPHIANGTDLQAVGEIFMQQFIDQIEEHGFDGSLRLDAEILDRRLADLPTEPDEKLR